MTLQREIVVGLIAFFVLLILVWIILGGAGGSGGIETGPIK